MRHLLRLAAIVLLAPTARAQKIENVQPVASAHSALFRAATHVAREFKLSAEDFVTFRDPQWSALTLAQIGAATADVVTSVNSLNHCASCFESGPSRLFVGRHPDAHKYIVAGSVEISVEALAARYFRRNTLSAKWYWRMLWAFPQSLSLFEHAKAAEHNASLD